MKKILLWLTASAAVLLSPPFLAATFLPGSSGMAVCLFLFFVLDPLYAILAGIFAGRDLKKLWVMPLIVALFFLTGTWLFLEWGETDFLLYGAVYLFLGGAAMLITYLVTKNREKGAKQGEFQQTPGGSQ